MNDYSTSTTSMSLPAFSPSGIGSALTGGIFYILMAIILFFSVASIYTLNKYSDSKVTAVVISIVYGIIFLSLFGSGVHTL
jgi:hypothetical protein